MAFYIKDVIRSAATFPVFTWVVIEMRNSGYTNNFLKSFLKPLVILLPLFINLSSPSQARNENLAKHTAALQNSLNFFGFEAGEPDGILGKKTKAAISLMHECLYQKASVGLSKSSQDFLIESFEIAKAQQLKGSCSLLKNFTSSAFQCSKPTWRHLFSCSFSKGKELVTICGAEDQARYRSGLTGKIPNITIVQPLKDVYIPWMGSGRYQSEAIAFHQNDVIYKVYSSVDSLSDDNSFTAGIDIVHLDKITGSFSCDSESIAGKMSEASNFLESSGLCWSLENEIWGSCQKEGGWARFVDGPIFPYEAYQRGEFFSPCETSPNSADLQSRAYEYGLYLQELVRTKDLSSLYDHVKGPLINGPEKKTIKGFSFDDFFSKNWRKTAIEIEPECVSVGTRGYMLGRGLIWFDREQDIGTGKASDGWKIISINNDLMP